MSTVICIECGKKVKIEKAMKGVNFTPENGPYLHAWCFMKYIDDNCSEDPIPKSMTPQAVSAAN